MAKYLRKRWEPRFEGLTRQDRRGCSYDAYLPDPLSGWNLMLPSDLAADIADAEAAIGKLNRGDTEHVSLEGLARFLLRAESVASSKIEGLDVSVRRLIAAESGIAQGGGSSDRAATEVLANIASMQSAVDLAAESHQISLDDLLSVHRELMTGSSTPQFGGTIRDRQNWIGGSAYNPCSAAFVPPPPQFVENLIEDLIEYVNDDAHSPLVQAAIAHAQFETIHPFADGNGRSGRALIHIVLQRRRLATRFVPPISLVLATWSADYIAGLGAYRHLGSPDSDERSAGAQVWLRIFAGATLRACVDAQRYAARIDEMTADWREHLGRVRLHSATDLLIRVLPGAPLITTSSASAMIGRSEVATSSAINRLLDAGILRQRNIERQRYRIFEAPDVINLFTSLERALASPAGDTATEGPVRPVPRSGRQTPN